MKKLCIFLAIIFIVVPLCSCASENSNDNSGMVTIEKYKSSYSEDASVIKNRAYQHIDMQKAVFSPFPECDHVESFISDVPDVTVEESLSIIKKWLDDNGFTVDLEHELFAATSQFEGENGNHYPLVMPHVNELNDGNGFFINTNQCHIQMGRANIYSMSTGVISKYVKSEKAAGLDAMGAYSENVIAEGLVEELSGCSYELLNGPVSIGDAAETVKEYFEKGTPYLNPKEISIEVPYVKVFAIGDIYGYEFNVREVYGGIPFAYGDYGVYREDEYRPISLYIKKAYTISGNIDAYTGNSSNSVFTPIIEPSQDITPVSRAAEVLDNFVGNQMKIEIQNVGLEYIGITDTTNDTVKMYPCWSFKGYNSSDGRTYVFYVNVLGGDVFYHSFIESEM